MEMGSPVVQDRDRTAQRGWGTGVISLYCLRPATESLTLAVFTSPLHRRCVQPAFAVGQGLGQQGPEFLGSMGLCMMAVPRMAQRCSHKCLSLRCGRSPARLCLGCSLRNGDNGISHGRCRNAAINTGETGDYAVLALSVILFSVTARLIDSSNAGFRVLSLHRLAKKKGNFTSE